MRTTGRSRAKTSRRSTKSVATQSPHRKATTIRIAPLVQKRLELLAQLRGAPLNRLVNAAVAQYVDNGLTEAEAGLTGLLEKVRASRRDDPDFESSIADFVAAEASLAAQDPVEGEAFDGKPRAKKHTRRPTRALIHQALRA